MAKVYVLQEVMRKVGEDSNGSAIMAPVMDFRRALEYGELVICLPAGRVSLTPGPTIDTLKEKLRDFSDDDYLLPVGNPGLIAVAGAIASENNRGKFKVLVWDKDSRQYIKVDYDLNYRRNKNV